MTGVETPINRIRLSPGDRVGDHLIVRSVLGEGGTAVVYEALHTRLGALVALKVLEVPDAFLQDGVLRMQREAEVCASIDDPHVPRIYDINRLPDGTPYVVMEKVSGTTLEEMLSRGPLSLEAVYQIADDLMAALEAVHRAGVVHRDIKPANLILKVESDGTYRVRLMDFGVSKSVCREPSDPKLTRAGTVVGTPHYMAPEQITGDAVDARADVYATGVVLFEMLVGRMPFEGETTAEVVAAVLRHTPLSLGSLRPEVPGQVEDLVMQAMAARPADRFLTVRDMRAALVRCRAEVSPQRGSVLSLMPPPRGFEDRDSYGELITSSVPPPARSATRRYSILGAGFAVLIGTIGFPRAAKHHESTTEFSPAQVAKADVEPEGAFVSQTDESAKEAHEDGEPAAVEAAPQYRLQLSTQHLQIAAPPTEADATEPFAAPEKAAPLEPARDGDHQLRQELAFERRASREEERLARKRLREAEAAIEEDDEEGVVDQGVLISDYVQQLEAIQRAANEEGPSAVTESAAPPPQPSEGVPPANVPLPENPYPN